MPRTPTLARSRMMAAVKAKHTKPELQVRRLAHAMGLRFRLHGRGLPGTPCLVLPGRGAVVFVNDCFWHGHGVCKRWRMPKTRDRYWEDKLAANKKRDRRDRRRLRALGWRVVTIWECDLRSTSRERAKLAQLHSIYPTEER